jgi:dolichol-phosphate mannosyltransferase
LEKSNNLKGLIFIPTYNERENIEKLIDQLDQLNLGFDLLFVDDNSPDKTGDLLDSIAAQKNNLYVIHRPSKLGIGSAHIDGIDWAYKNGYQILITMDSDFSHSPAHINKLLVNSKNADIVVGSRYLQDDSLKEWNFQRKFLTRFGHFLTKLFLGMPYDATGAFRLYRLDKIPQNCFHNEKSAGYSFFFESLFILYKNHYKITEVAIDLPARTYGTSKMKFSDAIYSLFMLIQLIILNTFKPKTFFIGRTDKEIIKNNDVHDEQGWDEYWDKQRSVSNWFYDRIAEFFRHFLIRPYLNKFIRKHFAKGTTLVHAGCGSGQVDYDITNEYPVIAVDISINALEIYRSNHSQIEKMLQNDIRDMEFDSESIGGVYSLGVMEHFHPDELVKMLKEFNRILQPKGKAVIFWPPKFGLSVLFLNSWHFVLNKVLRKNVRLHPHEVSLLESKNMAITYAAQSDFTLVDYHFGIDDLFTQVVIVLQKI